MSVDYTSKNLEWEILIINFVCVPTRSDYIKYYM